MKRPAKGRRISCAPLAVLILGIPMPAEAFEFSGGVSAGAILAGTLPQLAVSPNVGVSWRVKDGFLIAARDLCSLMPAVGRTGVGVHNQTSGTVGYEWE